MESILGLSVVSRDSASSQEILYTSPYLGCHRINGTDKLVWHGQEKEIVLMAIEYQVGTDVLAW